MALSANPLMTAATQWMERTLDDSANRRLVLPEAFLALDGVLDVMRNVTSGLIVHPRVVGENLRRELPFMATENLLMAAVRNGADRQAAHEVVRKASLAAADRMKREGGDNDLLERLGAEPTFAGIDLETVLDPRAYTGLAPTQVDRFVTTIVAPIRARYAETTPDEATLRV